ncbi:I78 family peptidase inhibitor [Ramlibacter tataouinensis]|uniref:I78 family peptidase inhibitor n=1 Tax=Ramlibacter tataouinensis TaxID=94132 RepID=UPI0002EB1333|nr:I78 family peptidase inhibitor [Ramlibacter tataouinensis]
MSRRVVPLSRLAAAAGLLVLAGCAQQGPAGGTMPAPATAPPGAVSPMPAAPPAASPVPAPVPAPPAAVPAAPAAASPAPAPRVAGCNAAAARGALGYPYSDVLAERAGAAAGAESVRMTRAGRPDTDPPMAQRLNLEVDPMGNIVRITCG